MSLLQPHTYLPHTPKVDEVIRKYRMIFAFSIVALGIELEANVCTNYGLTDVCCSVFGKIVIRLCQGLTGGNFYVYKLSRPPGCYTGYCVDPVSGSCQPNYERDIDNNCTR